MLYVKNVGKGERVARVLAGLAMAAAGAWLFGRNGAWVGGALGLGTALTGLFGFCPACAAIGRSPRA